MEQIQNFASDEAAQFVAENFSEGIIERNGKERLIGMMETLQQEMGGLQLIEVGKSGDHAQLILGAPDFPDRMILSLVFAGNKIEGMAVDMM